MGLNIPTDPGHSVEGYITDSKLLGRWDQGSDLVPLSTWLSLGRGHSPQIKTSENQRLTPWAIKDAGMPPHTCDQRLFSDSLPSFSTTSLHGNLCSELCVATPRRGKAKAVRPLLYTQLWFHSRKSKGASSI